MLEGDARHGVPEGPVAGGPLRVVHATADGDAAVLAEVRSAGPPVVVVTSDRALRAHVLAAGGQVAGPSRLPKLLDAAGG